MGEQTQHVAGRTERALEDGQMSVYPDAPPVKGADGMVLVVSNEDDPDEETKAYTVDAKDRACMCKDFQYRGTYRENGEQKIRPCKHIRRARFALGLDKIPARAVMDCSVDPELGSNTDVEPEVDTSGTPSPAES